MALVMHCRSATKPSLPRSYARTCRGARVAAGRVVAPWVAAGCGGALSHPHTTVDRVWRAPARPGWRTVLSSTYSNSEPWQASTVRTSTSSAAP